MMTTLKNIPYIWNIHFFVRKNLDLISEKINYKPENFHDAIFSVDNVKVQQ